MDKQISTKRVSIRWIMQDPAFEHGVRDARAGQPFPVGFDTWQTNKCWNYERGRAWARCVPASVDLKRNARLSDEAVRCFMRLGWDIL